MIGFNVSEYRDAAHSVMISHSGLWSIPIGIRDDSKDLAVTYPAEDEGENTEVEEPVVIPDNSDDSDSASDDDSDFNIDDGSTFKEVVEG